MLQRQIPETIEGDWDAFYRDYPEIYHAWGQYAKKPDWIDIVREKFPLSGKTVADIGSGSGVSTFELARYAQEVIGVEPEAAMRSIAVRSAAEMGLTNVRFVEGWAEKNPLPDASVDMVTGITLASTHCEENIVGFIRESERITRPGSVILAVDLASRWHGGELAEIILGMPRSAMSDAVRDLVYPKYGFSAFDYFADQDYGSVENAVRTYGFIFGRKAIDYIRANHKTVIRWKICVHFKIKE